MQAFLSLYSDMFPCLFLYWTVFTSLEICCISQSLIVKQNTDFALKLFHGFYFGIVLFPCCGNSPEMACLSSSALPISFKCSPIGPWSTDPVLMTSLMLNLLLLEPPAAFLTFRCAGLFPPHSPASPDSFHVSTFTLSVWAVSLPLEGGHIVFRVCSSCHVCLLRSHLFLISLPVDLNFISAGKIFP